MHVPSEDSKYRSEEAFTEIENEYRFYFIVAGWIFILLSSLENCIQEDMSLNLRHIILANQSLLIPLMLWRMREEYRKLPSIISKKLYLKEILGYVDCILR